MSAAQTSKLDECMELYMEGAGDVEIADHLGITIKKFNELCEENESFRTFVERGSTAAQAWWWKQARSNLKNRAFMHSMWAFNMKNRYGWAEKTEATSTGETDMNIDSLQRQLTQALKDLQKKNPELAKSFRVLESLNG